MTPVPNSTTNILPDAPPDLSSSAARTPITQTTTTTVKSYKVPLFEALRFTSPGPGGPADRTP